MLWQWPASAVLDTSGVLWLGMSFQCPGVLSPPTYSHDVSTVAAVPVPAPSPLSADQSMHGKAQEEDDTEAPGMLPSERKGKEVYFFLFHTPSSLMASACFPKLNHRFREKGWDLNRSENNGGGFPGGAVVKNLSANTGDTGSIPGLGRSPGGGDGNPLQYSCLGNPLDRGAWRAIVHGVTKSQTQLSDWVHKQNHEDVLPKAA